jgi:hypothetical protein
MIRTELDCGEDADDGGHDAVEVAGVFDCEPACGLQSSVQK